jgi:broad specificity phosphatase PhoE
MRVQVFRHGQSLSNAGGRTDDPALIPLTPAGEAEARALARSLTAPPDLLLVSPYLRSVETARPIRARYPDVNIEVWPIQEFTYLAPAACVGTSWIERKPWIDAYWTALDPEKIDGPGAENFRSLLMRASAFLHRLARLDARHVVAISHGQFMQATKLMIEPHGAHAVEGLLLELEHAGGRVVIKPGG